MSDISKTKIPPISNHTPVLLTLVNKNVKPPTMNWRLNISMLKDPAFISFFKREWPIYIEYNNLPETLACVLWQAGKAVMRGKIIFPS